MVCIIICDCVVRLLCAHTFALCFLQKGMGFAGQCTGRLRPEVQPLTLSYTILAEKVPLLYTFIEKRYPFHIPILGSLVLVHVVLNK